MKRRNLAFCSTGLLFASAIPLSVWADVGTSSFSGTWQAGDKSTELVVEQTGDNVHMTEQSGGKTLFDYTCKSNGKDCSFKEEGKKATVSVYFNGPKLVEIRTFGNVVMKRRFGLKDNGKILEVEQMPITPPGKTETFLYAKQ